MTKPQVTVLMAVYNGGRYLELAINSILSQDYESFELVVVDDGSTDGSLDLLSALRDPRVLVIKAAHNGLVAALNLGLACAQGDYVARMDADDVARGDRLSVQSDRLRANPEVGLVCSDVRIIDGHGRLAGAERERWPASSSRVREGLLYQRRMKPIIHPSVMIRREVLERVGGYREFPAAEDRDLWLRAFDVCRFERVQQDLLDYRIHPGGISRQSDLRQEVSSAMAVVNWHVVDQLGVDIFADRYDLFTTLAEGVERRIKREVLPQAQVFRAARSSFRAGRWSPGLAKMALGSIQHGRIVTADGARKAVLRIINETVAVARHAIVGVA